MRMLLQKSQFGWGGDARKEARLCLQEKCLGYVRVCTVKGLSFQVKEFRIDEMRFLLNGNLGSCEEVYPKWGEQSGWECQRREGRPGLHRESHILTARSGGSKAPNVRKVLIK